MVSTHILLMIYSQVDCNPPRVVGNRRRTLALEANVDHTIFAGNMTYKAWYVAFDLRKDVLKTLNGKVETCLVENASGRIDVPSDRMSFYVRIR